jgi:uncharacterized protein (UPF0332 family)
MKVEIYKLIEKANDCLESAELNQKEGFYDAAVNRSYYAVFDVLTALLLSKGITVKSHSGAIKQFANYFIRTEILKIEMQEVLIFCFHKRQKGDYDLYSDILESEGLESIEKARYFVNNCKVWLELYVLN